VYKAQAKPKPRAKNRREGGRGVCVCQAMKSSLNISGVLAKHVWAGLGWAACAQQSKQATYSFACPAKSI